MNHRLEEEYDALHSGSTRNGLVKAAYDLHVRRPEFPSPLRRWVHEYYETGLGAPPREPARIPVSATTDPVLNVMLSGSLVVRIGDGFRLPPVLLTANRADGIVHPCHSRKFAARMEDLGYQDVFHYETEEGGTRRWGTRRSG